MRNDDDREASEAWFDKGDGDLRVARASLALCPPEADAACFHCQQAAEKYLKGFLAWHGERPPHTHNLIVLIDLALPFDQDLDALREAARPLLPFAVGVRYPQIENPPDAEEAAQALHHAETICQTVRACLFGS